MGLKCAGETEVGAPGGVGVVEGAGDVGVDVFEFEGDADAAFDEVVDGLGAVYWVVGIGGEPGGTGVEESADGEVVEGPVVAKVTVAIEPVGDVEEGQTVAGEGFEIVTV